MLKQHALQHMLYLQTISMDIIFGCLGAFLAALVVLLLAIYYRCQPSSGDISTKYKFDWSQHNQILQQLRVLIGGQCSGIELFVPYKGQSIIQPILKSDDTESIYSKDKELTNLSEVSQTKSENLLIQHIANPGPTSPIILGTVLQISKGIIDIPFSILNAILGSPASNGILQIHIPEPTVASVTVSLACLTPETLDIVFGVITATDIIIPDPLSQIWKFSSQFITGFVKQKFEPIFLPFSIIQNYTSKVLEKAKISLSEVASLPDSAFNLPQINKFHSALLVSPLRKQALYTIQAVLHILHLAGIAIVLFILSTIKLPVIATQKFIVYLDSFVEFQLTALKWDKTDGKAKISISGILLIGKTKIFLQNVILRPRYLIADRIPSDVFHLTDQLLRLITKTTLNDSVANLFVALIALFDNLQLSKEDNGFTKKEYISGNVSKITNFVNSIDFSRFLSNAVSHESIKKLQGLINFHGSNPSSQITEVMREVTLSAFKSFQSGLNTAGEHVNQVLSRSPVDLDSTVRTYLSSLKRISLELQNIIYKFPIYSYVVQFTKKIDTILPVPMLSMITTMYSKIMPNPRKYFTHTGSNLRKEVTIPEVTYMESILIIQNELIPINAFYDAMTLNAEIKLQDESQGLIISSAIEFSPKIKVNIKADTKWTSKTIKALEVPSLNQFILSHCQINKDEYLVTPICSLNLEYCKSNCKIVSFKAKLLREFKIAKIIGKFKSPNLTINLKVNELEISDLLLKYNAYQEPSFDLAIEGNLKSLTTSDWQFDEDSEQPSSCSPTAIVLDKANIILDKTISNVSLKYILQATSDFVYCKHHLNLRGIVALSLGAIFNVPEMPELGIAGDNVTLEIVLALSSSLAIWLKSFIDPESIDNYGNESSVNYTDTKTKFSLASESSISELKIQLLHCQKKTDTLVPNMKILWLQPSNIVLTDSTFDTKPHELIFNYCHSIELKKIVQNVQPPIFGSTDKPATLPLNSSIPVNLDCDTATNSLRFSLPEDITNKAFNNYQPLYEQILDIRPLAGRTIILPNTGIFFMINNCSCDSITFSHAYYIDYIIIENSDIYSPEKMDFLTNNKTDTCPSIAILNNIGRRVTTYMTISQNKNLLKLRGPIFLDKSRSMQLALLPYKYCSGWRGTEYLSTTWDTSNEYLNRENKKQLFLSCIKPVVTFLSILLPQFTYEISSYAVTVNKIILVLFDSHEDYNPDESMYCNTLSAVLNALLIYDNHDDHQVSIKNKLTNIISKIKEGEPVSFGYLKKALIDETTNNPEGTRHGIDANNRLTDMICTTISTICTPSEYLPIPIGLSPLPPLKRIGGWEGFSIQKLRIIKIKKLKFTPRVFRKRLYAVRLPENIPIYEPLILNKQKLSENIHIFPQAGRHFKFNESHKKSDSYYQKRQLKLLVIYAKYLNEQSLTWMLNNITLSPEYRLHIKLVKTLKTTLDSANDNRLVRTFLFPGILSSMVDILYLDPNEFLKNENLSKSIKSDSNYTEPKLPKKMLLNPQECASLLSEASRSIFSGTESVQNNVGKLLKLIFHQGKSFTLEVLISIAEGMQAGASDSGRELAAFVRLPQDKAESPSDIRQSIENMLGLPGLFPRDNQFAPGAIYSHLSLIAAYRILSSEIFCYKRAIPLRQRNGATLLWNYYKAYAANNINSSNNCNLFSTIKNFDYYEHKKLKLFNYKSTACQLRYKRYINGVDKYRGYLKKNTKCLMNSKSMNEKYNLSLEKNDKKICEQTSIVKRTSNNKLMINRNLKYFVWKNSFFILEREIEDALKYIKFWSKGLIPDRRCDILQNVFTHIVSLQKHWRNNCVFTNKIHNFQSPLLLSSVRTLYWHSMESLNILSVLRSVIEDTDNARKWFQKACNSDDLFVSLCLIDDSHISQEDLPSFNSNLWKQIENYLLNRPNNVTELFSYKKMMFEFTGDELDECPYNYPTPHYLVSIFLENDQPLTIRTMNMCRIYHEDSAFLVFLTVTIANILNIMIYSSQDIRAMIDYGLVLFLMPECPEEKYNLHVVSAMGIITKGRRGKELSETWLRAEKWRGVYCVRGNTGTVKAVAENAGSLVTDVISMQTSLALKNNTKEPVPWAYVGYSQGCSNALAMETSLLTGSPDQIKIVQYLRARLMLYPATNGSVQADAGLRKMQVLASDFESAGKLLSGNYSSQLVATCKELLSSLMLRQHTLGALAGMASVSHEKRRADWRTSVHSLSIPSTVIRGVATEPKWTHIEKELIEPRIPDMLAVIAPLLEAEERHRCKANIHHDQPINFPEGFLKPLNIPTAHDSQVHVDDATAFPTLLDKDSKNYKSLINSPWKSLDTFKTTTNINSELLRKWTMPTSIYRDHHWAPLYEEVLSLASTYDLQMEKYSAPKDRHIIPWLEQSARFGIIDKKSNQIL